MGTLGGHLLPGTFFAMFAIWWGFITSIRFIQSKQKSNTKKNKEVGYKGTVTMPFICLPCSALRKAPIESYLKFSLALIALIIEFGTGLKIWYVKPHDLITESQTMQPHTETHEMGHDHGKRSVSDGLVRTWTFEKGNAQHITMYSAFILGSVVEIMVHYGVELPKKIEYAMGIVAFAVEAFLFAFHLHGKEPVDAYLHVLLVYSIMGCVIFCMLETYDPTQVLFTYGRVLFTLLQGTWFYQVGFMLYPPTDSPAFKWNMNDHGVIMIVTVCFCWHVLLIIVALFMQYWCVKKIFFRSNYMKLKSQLDELIYIDNKNMSVSENKNEMRFLTLETDSDDNSLDEGKSIDNKFLNSKFSNDNHL